MYIIHVLMFGVTIGFLVWLYMWTRQTSVDFHILLKDGKAHITRPGTTLDVVTDIDNLDEPWRPFADITGALMRERKLMEKIFDIFRTILFEKENNDLYVEAFSALYNN